MGHFIVLLRFIATIIMREIGEILNKMQISVLRKRLLGGIFLIGLGVILVKGLHWATILILLGAIFVIDGVTRYYFEERGSEKSDQT